jgi:hypothetical protein
MRDIEQQLRDWGNAIPSSVSDSPLMVEDLGRLKERRSQRFQKLLTMGVVGIVALLLSGLPWLEPTELRLVRERTGEMASRPTVKTPTPVAEMKAEETVPEPAVVLYTTISDVDASLRQRWIETKRMAARDRVLQQWLAENR